MICFYLGTVNHSLINNIDEYHVIESENVNLKKQITKLNEQIAELDQQVVALHQTLAEVEVMEKEIKATKVANLDPMKKDWLSEKITSTLKFNQSANDSLASSQAILSNLEKIKEKINRAKSAVESQHKSLSQLKKRLEKEEELALYIPTIPPADGRITSPYGWRKDPFHGERKMHKGIDFADEFKAPIYATASGTVVATEEYSGYGKQIRIDHGNGYVTTYSHLNKYEVKKGDKVKKGDIIGRMGSTGRSTGVHLHYEVHKDGKAINPIQYVKGERLIAGKEITNR